MMWGYPVTWWGMVAMTVGMVLWFGLVLVAIWALVRWLMDRGPARGPAANGPSALEILQQRYARGEIDAATYEEMRARLEGTTLPRAPHSREPASTPR